MSLPDFPLYSPGGLVIADPKERERRFRQALSKGALNWEVGDLEAETATLSFLVAEMPVCSRSLKEWSQAETALMISTGVLPRMGNYKPQPLFNVYFLS